MYFEAIAAQKDFGRYIKDSENKEKKRGNDFLKLMFLFSKLSSQKSRYIAPN